MTRNDQIRETRERLGMSQETLAERVGMSQETLAERVGVIRQAVSK